MTGATRCLGCADSLLELSGRGSTNLESAKRVMASCPHCSDELENLARGLVLARALPREEPATQADLLILELADQRYTDTPPRSS